MKTTPLIDAFVAHFGEMGSRWGLNRTFGQIFALVYASPRPLNADEIAEALAFSRSNVSQGLKELQAWRLVRLRHHAGDRREYFEAPADAWEVFLTLAEERRRREIEPTIEMLRQALASAGAGGEDPLVLARLRDLHDCMRLATTWFDEVRHLERATLTQLMALGARVQKLLGTSSKRAAATADAAPFGLESGTGAGLESGNDASDAPAESGAAPKPAFESELRSGGTPANRAGGALADSDAAPENGTPINGAWVDGTEAQADFTRNPHSALHSPDPVHARSAEPRAAAAAVSPAAGTFSAGAAPHPQLTSTQD